MESIDWTLNIVVKVFRWLEPMIYLLGLGICVWGYWRQRHRGFLLVAAYFLLAVIMSAVIPEIDRARYHAWVERNPGTAQQRTAYADELALLQDKYAEASRPVGVINLRFPLGPILLVAGIWLLARRDKPGAKPCSPAQ